MFKNYQDTSSADQFKGFPNLNFQGSNSAYRFSGVSFWLDAAFGLNTQTNLGAVSRWQQRVGGGVFTQGTAGNQPRLILNDANYNNFPSVEAQDTARYMFGNFTYDALNMTIAIISKVNTPQQFNCIFGSPTPGNNDPARSISDGGLNSGMTGFGSHSINPAGSGVSFLGNTENTNARIKILTANNVIVNSNIETTGTANAGLSITTSQLFRTQFFNYNLVGSLAEVIVYNYSMTSTDAIALSDRINQKYALY
jgi:hypothetical protein